jgi:hypothetical protein
LENSFFNWTGVPSVFLLDDLSALKEITKPCLSNHARCRISFVSQIIPQQMICLSKKNLKPALLRPAVK